jgi:hypothetical protein
MLGIYQRIARLELLAVTVVSWVCRPGCPRRPWRDVECACEEIAQDIYADPGVPPDPGQIPDPDPGVTP